MKKQIRDMVQDAEEDIMTKSKPAKLDLSEDGFLQSFEIIKDDVRMHVKRELGLTMNQLINSLIGLSILFIVLNLVAFLIMQAVIQAGVLGMTINCVLPVLFAMFIGFGLGKKASNANDDIFANKIKERLT
jgi:hypothetical protein